MVRRNGGGGGGGGGEGGEGGCLSKALTVIVRGGPSLEISGGGGGGGHPGLNNSLRQLKRGASAQKGEKSK